MIGQCKMVFDFVVSNEFRRGVITDLLRFIEI